MEIFCISLRDLREKSFPQIALMFADKNKIEMKSMFNFLFQN